MSMTCGFKIAYGGGGCNHSMKNLLARNVAITNRLVFKFKNLMLLKVVVFKRTKRWCMGEKRPARLGD